MVRSDIMKKSSKRKKKPMNRNLKVFLVSFASFMALGIIVTGLIVYFAAINSVDYINYSSLGLDFSSVIYYTDDEGNHHEYEQIYGEQNRVWATSDEIPQDLFDAFVSIEDERFYKHHGFDLKRTTKATMNYIFNRSSAYGGSTINQQIVKNITGKKDATPQRKILEIVRAIDMDLKLDKQQILEIYANTIYLSQGCYGVKTASEKYFGKDVSELTLAECASIAGITQYPTYYDPLQNPENNKNKQELVLSKMLELGYITQQEHDEAVAQDLVFYNNEVSGITSNHSYFTEQIINDVLNDLQEKKNLSKEIAVKMIYSGGLQIYSTVDPAVQDRIDVVYANPKEHILYNEEAPIQSAMVVIDHSTGEVVGIGGGLGKKDSRTLNRATQSYRQPGSTIKPLSVYGPGFDRGVFTPATIYEDKAYSVGNHTYKNYYEGYKGKVSVRYAIQQSINTVAVQCLDDLTLATSYDYMKNKFNFSKLVPDDIAYSPLAVGGLTNGVSVLELTAAYSAIANDGIYIKPHTYTKVCDMDGNVLLEHKNETNVVLSEKAAHTTMSTLRSVVTHGTGGGAWLSSGTQTAGKTGTTDDDKDRWFVGLSPYYTAAVWVGYDTPKTITGYGANPALTLWRAVMEPVHNKLEKKSFNLPKADNSGATTVLEPTVVVTICEDSGLLPGDLCALDYRGSRVIETEVKEDEVPTEVCTAHQYVTVDTSTGMAANSNCPLSSVETRVQPVPEVCTAH